jgi:hypothetical protein
LCVSAVQAGRRHGAARLVYALLNTPSPSRLVPRQIAIKGCRDVAFSNGGHYFAAINGITVSIYNTYTCECLGNLRGHNSKVCTGGEGGGGQCSPQAVRPHGQPCEGGVCHSSACHSLTGGLGRCVGWLRAGACHLLVHQ